MSLKDKTIVVTGGSRGLGLGTRRGPGGAGRQGDRRGARPGRAHSGEAKARRRRDLRRCHRRGAPPSASSPRSARTSWC